ncbi:MAG TPA: hypothetical protein VF406_16150 [Thermodesulfobacteriota bacterium]
MAWTQADIEALEAAIASGVLTVRAPDGRTVTYQSTEAMLQALAMMKRELAEASGATPRYQRVATSKGV